MKKSWHGFSHIFMLAFNNIFHVIEHKNTKILHPHAKLFFLTNAKSEGKPHINNCQICTTNNQEKFHARSTASVGLNTFL
jgi:hypothetical protein